MFATPPLLTDDPAEQLHEIAGNPPTSGSSCSATAAAASLATAVARQTLSAGTLDTAVAPSTTPTSSSDILLQGDFVAVTGLPGASLVEPQYVPLPIDANLEDMDTTITRKRSRPSELGSDDEGASRKVQAVGTAPHNASTTKLPPHVTGEDDRHLNLASGITTEGEFQQVLSKAQKRRQRSALPPGLAGNIPSPGTEPAVAPAARPTAPCSSPAPIAPPDVDPVATAGKPDAAAWLRTAEGFGRTWQFPNCIGAVDGKHVHIKRPKNSGTMYFNYKLLRGNGKGSTCPLLALPGASASTLSTFDGTPTCVREYAMDYFSFAALSVVGFPPPGGQPDVRRMSERQPPFVLPPASPQNSLGREHEPLPLTSGCEQASDLTR
ncbi:hypothetical protein HPB49_014342 [Dermacentor silvarum]|uniref:Uncharacterized protein n=1 Tax=Dermacentor silvarum TaxID=543639 RepID=A0ACB8CLI3_DERSI|nr:hypothetical protein HPB49_014342 [Dermacentor silvarum]